MHGRIFLFLCLGPIINATALADHAVRSASVLLPGAERTVDSSDPFARLKEGLVNETNPARLSRILVALEKKANSADVTEPELEEIVHVLKRWTQRDLSLAFFQKPAARVFVKTGEEDIGAEERKQCLEKPTLALAKFARERGLMHSILKHFEALMNGDGDSRYLGLLGYGALLNRSFGRKDLPNSDMALMESPDKGVSKVILGAVGADPNNAIPILQKIIEMGKTEQNMSWVARIASSLLNAGRPVGPTSGPKSPNPRETIGR